MAMPMMLNVLLQEHFDKLNSLTKYPSILTYHELGKKGKLNEELTFPVPADKSLSTVYETEKVDGTNGRIIINGSDYAIGSREEILHAKGDRVINKNLGIVEQLIPYAEKIVEKSVFPTEVIVVIYGEVYGGNIGANKKQYTNKGQYGFRVFDIAVFPVGETIVRILGNSRDKLASWRENGGQSFVSVSDLQAYCNVIGLPIVPYVTVGTLGELPTTIEGMYKYLDDDQVTYVGLDEVGVTEGRVFRTEDRGYIVKARLEDYERTLGIQRK